MQKREMGERTGSINATNNTHISSEGLNETKKI